MKQHKHHIIPLHMNGPNDQSNLVELTVEEHAEAHRKLFEQYGLWQDELAWKGLAGIIGHEEAVRMSQSLANKGKIVTEEQKKKQSEKMKGRKLTKEHRDNISKGKIGLYVGEKNPMFGRCGEKSPVFGRKHTEEEKEKIRLKMIGNTNKPKKPKQPKLPRKFLLGDLNPSKRDDVREKIRQSKLGKKRPFAKRRVRNEQGELVWSNS